jgi:hypothetical protein
MLSDLSEPQQDLAKYMSAISEAAYAAAWMAGLEFELWRAVNHGPFLYGRLLLTHDHIARLRELSASCGGWIRFDEHREEQFVALDTWEALATGA